MADSGYPSTMCHVPTHSRCSWLDRYVLHFLVHNFQPCTALCVDAELLRDDQMVKGLTVYVLCMVGQSHRTHSREQGCSCLACGTPALHSLLPLYCSDKQMIRQEEGRYFNSVPIHGDHLYKNGTMSKHHETGTQSKQATDVRVNGCGAQAHKQTIA